MRTPSDATAACLNRERIVRKCRVPQEPCRTDILIEPADRKRVGGYTEIHWVAVVHAGSYGHY